MPFKISLLETLPKFLIKGVNYNAMYKLFNKILILTVFFLVLSCNEDEEPEKLFDTSPTERLNTKIDELRQLLKSSENGWEFLYYPSEDNFGGFRFYFNFIDDKNVLMSSDFDDDTSVISSEYDVILGSSVKLSFTTRNDIHKLSDGANPPDVEFRGRGYLGQFEFVFNRTEGGDLIFRENRTFERSGEPREFRFKKATSSLPQFIDNSRLNIPNISSVGKSVYRSMQINNAGQITSYDIFINENRRYATASNAESTIEFGYGYTPTGFVISPEFKVGNKMASEFVYDSDSDQFVSDLGGGDSVVIGFQNSPPVSTNDFQIITETPNTFAFFSNFLGDAITTTGSFNSLLNQTNTNLSDLGFVVDRIDIALNIDTSFPTLSVLVYRGEGFEDILHFVTYSLVDEKIVFSNVQWNVEQELVDLLEPLDDFLVNPQGLFVKREDFTVRFSNTIYTFTSAENPSIRTTTYRL